MAETDSIQSSMKALEQKMEGLSGIMKTVQDDVDEVYMLFSDKDSEYFRNLADSLHSSLKSSMGEVEQDRRLYEEAMEQNSRAMKFSGNGPERGDMDFWEKAFAPTQKSAVQTQTEAISSALKDPSITEQMKAIFGSDTVKAALRGDVDDRTRGEKVMDFLGLGKLNEWKTSFLDRNVKADEKATKNDQVEIKRSNKEIERIKAAYRKESGKKDGGDKEKLEKLHEQYIAKMNQIESAKTRIEERTKDPFADLTEMKDGIFARKDPSKGAAEEKKEDTLEARLYEELSSMMKSLTANDKSRMDATYAGMKEPDIHKQSEKYGPNTNVKEPTVEVMGEKLRSPTAQLDKSKAIDAEIVAPEQPVYRGIAGEPVKALSYDKNEPVELSSDKVNVKTAGKFTDEKEAADRQGKLDNLRESFYKKGIGFYDKALSGDLLSAAFTGGGLGSALGKGGMYAAGAAVVAASLYKIGEAGLLVKDWIKSSSEARENIDKNLEHNNKSIKEKYDKGWNSSRIEADMAENEARAESAKEDGVLGQADQALEGIFGRFGWKSGKKKAEEKLQLAQAEAKKQQALARRFKKEAESAGIDVNDANAMKAARAEFDKHGKLGAGSMRQDNAPTAQTPGANTDPSKVETAEEQAKRVEEASYQGTKRAMMDPEVQKQNEENAKQTGKQINDKLVGRK